MIPGDDDRQPLADFDGVAAGRSHVLNHLVGFVTDLRKRGVDIPTNASVHAAQALAVVGFADRDQAQTALRAALIAHPDDIATFDALFPEFWRALRGEADPDPWTPPEQTGVPSAHQGNDESTISPSMAAEDWTTVRERAVTSADSSPRSTAAQSTDAAVPRVSRAVYSPMGRSHPMARQHVGKSTGMRAAVTRLGDAIATRPGRRWEYDGIERVDARKALRQSIGTGGVVATLPHQSRKRTTTQAVILVDVSQSVLDTVDRGVLIEFLAVAHEEWTQLRTFFFDTDVREVTDVFEAGTDPAGALERAETEWGGGTRIGHAIETVCRLSPVAIDRDTVVIIVSDGLEVGEIDRLERAMTRLHRQSRAVLWFNPLAVSPSFEPTCRGMAVSLPYLDGLFAFTGPADLAETAEQLLVRGFGGPVGYEYDSIRQATES